MLDCMLPAQRTFSKQVCRGVESVAWSSLTCHSFTVLSLDPATSSTACEMS